MFFRLFFLKMKANSAENVKNDKKSNKKQCTFEKSMLT